MQTIHSIWKDYQQFVTVITRCKINVVAVYLHVEQARKLDIHGIQDFLFVFLVLLTFISIVSSKGFHGDPESQVKTVNVLSPTLQ